MREDQVMDQRRPACGDETAHEAHGIWKYSYTVWVECPGWTETEAGTSALLDRMRQECRERYPMAPPCGLTLECHPLVSYLLQGMLIPGYAEFVASLEAGGDGMMKLQVPVSASPALVRGAWKLASGSSVIAEGVIP
jgi:hypothetical protein